MSGNFGYQNDPSNEWKTPKEFYDDGGGDCEDFAIFCAYFMYIELGIEANLIIQYNHALLEYWRDDGIQVWIYVEGAKQVTQPGMEDTISDRIPYYEMMYRAHYLN